MPLGAVTGSYVDATFTLNGVTSTIRLVPGTELRTFVDPGGSITAIRTPETAAFNAANPDTWPVEVTYEPWGLSASLIWFLETGDQSRLMTARQVVDSGDQPDWTGCTFAVSDMTPLSAGASYPISDGGEFHPFAIEVLGPPGIENHLNRTQFGEPGAADYSWAKDPNNRIYLMPALPPGLNDAPPKVFLALPQIPYALRPGADLFSRTAYEFAHPKRPVDGRRFEDGLLAGLGDTGVSYYDGGKELIKGAVHNALKFNVPYQVVRHVRTRGGAGASVGGAQNTPILLSVY